MQGVTVIRLFFFSSIKCILIFFKVCFQNLFYIFTLVLLKVSFLCSCSVLYLKSSNKEHEVKTRTVRILDFKQTSLSPLCSQC